MTPSPPPHHPGSPPMLSGVGGWVGWGSVASPDSVWFPPVSPRLGGEPGWWWGGGKGVDLPGHCHGPSKNWTSPVTVMVLLKTGPSRSLLWSF